MQLTFRPVHLDVNPQTRAAHIVAGDEGRNIDVLRSRAMIEDLAGVANLDQNASVRVVGRSEKLLGHAAEIARARFSDRCPAVAVEISHLAMINSVIARNIRALACAA